MIGAIGTYLPVWGRNSARVVGSDEDAVTMAVEAGRAALAASPSVVRTERVVLVTRDLPLLEGGNSAPLLAGLGLAEDTEVVERLGGAPATLESAATAGPGTVVIGVDAGARAGAAAVVAAGTGADLTISARINRSLPERARTPDGRVYDYGDARLLRELGLFTALAHAGVDAKAIAVAGIEGKEASALCAGSPPALPTLGASAPLFALAALVEARSTGLVLAVEQAALIGAELGGGLVAVHREEPAVQPRPVTRLIEGSDLAISLAAYERAFDAKLRLEAARCTTCGTLSYPPRLRCLECGSQDATEVVALPREAEVYTVTTVHVPVPGLEVPYSLAVVELGDTGVRLLVQVTDAAPGTAAISDRGKLVFRRVAIRSGVPDYGYAFRRQTDEGGRS